jgi:hypothetical protein
MKLNMLILLATILLFKVAIIQIKINHKLQVLLRHVAPAKKIVAFALIVRDVNIAI